VITGEAGCRRLKSATAFVPSKRAQRRPLIIPQPARNDPSIDLRAVVLKAAALVVSKGGQRCPITCTESSKSRVRREKSIEDAIQNAVSRASRTLRGVSWFEVLQTRGQVEGATLQYQVVLKVGFTLEEPS